MLTYHPRAGANWSKSEKGVYLTDQSFFDESGGIFLPSAHYEQLFMKDGKWAGDFYIIKPYRLKMSIFRGWTTAIFCLPWFLPLLLNFITLKRILFLPAILFAIFLCTSRISFSQDVKIQFINNAFDVYFFCCH